MPNTLTRLETLARSVRKAEGKAADDLVKRDDLALDLAGDGITYAELAKAMGISEDGVTYALRKARARRAQRVTT